MNTLQELQALEKEQQELKNKRRDRVLGTAEKGLDILGSAGGGSLLTAPFRLLKTIKDNAKKIYGGLSAPERARKQAELKQAVAFKKKQLGNQMKAQKQAQKQLVANEKMKAKINQGIQKKNPLGNAPVNQIKPNQKLDVGAKMQPYVNAQKMGGPKPLNVPKKTIGQVQPKPSNFNLDKTMQAAKVKSQKQQNKQMAQGLKNPVSMENKIKNVMGVN